MKAIDPQNETEQLHWLAFFALNGEVTIEQLRDSVVSMPAASLETLVQLADLHHVLLRIFEPVASVGSAPGPLISGQRAANANTLVHIAKVCHSLESQGCPVMVIKSTDHWPDLGNDVDLFTTGEPNSVHRVLKDECNAECQPQNWGDRLANKWNFRLPGLRPLVELHINRLGQTGELNSYGKELIERRHRRNFEGTPLWVPAREDQIVLATLQRLYRHFFYRICDFADGLAAVAEPFDFELLRLIAKRQGIWQGVATHLRLLSEYAEHYTGAAPALPPFVRKAARFGIERLYPHAGYLRLPLFPQGATLWGHQVIKTWHRRNRSGVLRLGLVPPLAAAASAAYKVTRKQRIW